MLIASLAGVGLLSLISYLIAEPMTSRLRYEHRLRRTRERYLVNFQRKMR